jgi:glycosyltransferase involved in cell wall biosynthesis
MPLVSVLMCSYNEDRLLEEAIESALAQTFQDFELVISDDASPKEETKRILKKYADHPNVRVIFNTQNRGYLDNKNFILTQAKGTYITQLDNDDLYAKNKLERQMEIIRKNPEVKIVSCGYRRIDASGNIEQIESNGSDCIIDKPQKDYPFWFPSLLCHKDVYASAGNFNEYFKGTLGDDYYWTIIANRNFPIYHIGETLYYYRYNPNSITNVLNNEMKIVVPMVLNELIEQNLRGEKDWLQKKDMKKISEFEKNILSDNKIMSEHYRIWAAKSVDKNDYKMARQLLKRSFLKHPLNLNTIRTLFYYVRKSMTK